ncbi:hypothetical protein MYA_3274 [Burkholderia sp. KJ006]|nr:hypothetical protein MYA_3274 [Burkholderia sp. KJ006]
MTGRHHSAARLGAVLADAGRPVRAFARMPSSASIGRMPPA